jgi:hypothetical protein
MGLPRLPGPALKEDKRVRFPRLQNPTSFLFHRALVPCSVWDKAKGKIVVESEGRRATKTVES